LNQSARDEPGPLPNLNSDEISPEGRSPAQHAQDEARRGKKEAWPGEELQGGRTSWAEQAGAVLKLLMQMFSISIETYGWTISLVSLLIAFNGVDSFSSPYHGTRFHDGTRVGTLTKGGNRNGVFALRKMQPSRAPFHVMQSQVDIDGKSKQVLLENTMTEVLQSVGLYPAGRSDVKNRIICENENKSLRIEAWGGDNSETIDQDNDKMLFLWLPGLDGTSMTGHP
jgi:hypothetical protein